MFALLPNFNMLLEILRIIVNVAIAVDFVIVRLLTNGFLETMQLSVSRMMDN